MKTILFICTGNYYRSRFAEILFNHLAKEKNIPYRAFSKGLRISSRNVGELSIHTKNYFDQLHIDYSNYLKMPEVFEEIHMKNVDMIIALDEQEHRPMIQQLFPHLEEKFIFWSFADDYIETPETVLPKLEKKVQSFINSLA